MKIIINFFIKIYDFYVNLSNYKDLFNFCLDDVIITFNFDYR